MHRFTSVDSMLMQQRVLFWWFLNQLYNCVTVSHKNDGYLNTTRTILPAKPVFECITDSSGFRWGLCTSHVSKCKKKKSDAVQVNKGCLLYKSSLSGKPFYKEAGSERQSDLKHPPVFCVIRNSFSTPLFLCLFSFLLFCLNPVWFAHLPDSSSTLYVYSTKLFYFWPGSIVHPVHQVQKGSARTCTSYLAPHSHFWRIEILIVQEVGLGKTTKRTLSR